jgi:DnaJ-class molecular chaperone
VASFDDVDRARRLLGLGNAASLDEVRRAYRQKAACHHPDKGSEDDKEMKEINWAYEFLMEYCRRYRFTFTKDDWRRAYPEDAYLERWIHEM